MSSSNCDCNYDYLKPITYDDLFDETSKKCTDYELIIAKLTEARSSFFLFQASIFNFINDCTRLKQKVREDLSGNDLLSITYEYKVLLNNLIAEIALAMRKKMKQDNSILLNFEVPTTITNKTVEDIQTLWPTNIVYSDIAGVDTLIISLPSVIIYLRENFQLQVKITTPKGLSYTNLTFDNTYIKSHNSKANDNFIKNMTPELSVSGTIYGFKDTENANDIFDDLINYHCDDSIFTHNLKEVIERLNGIMLSIENAHRSIIQKIKTEKINETIC